MGMGHRLGSRALASSTSRRRGIHGTDTRDMGQSTPHTDRKGTNGVTNGCHRMGEYLPACLSCLLASGPHSPALSLSLSLSYFVIYFCRSRATTVIVYLSFPLSSGLGLSWPRLLSI